MDFKFPILILTVTMGSSSYAAHIVTDTRDGDTLIKRSHTYANSDGDLRVDEQGFSSSATTSDSASTKSKPKVTFTPGPIEDTMIYQSRGKAVVVLEGEVCRKLTADSAPPPGLGAMGGNMGDARKQMAEAMQQANAAMEQAMAEARKQGMTPEQEKMMRQFTKPAMNIPDTKPRNALSISPLNDTVKVGQYSGEGYLVSDSDGNEKYKIWMTPASKIKGAKHVRKGLEGMMAVYEKYMDKMGGTALMDTSLSAMFKKDEFKNMYPIRTEDLNSGEITEVVEVRTDDGDVDFYPECEERDMMGF